MTTGHPQRGSNGLGRSTLTGAVVLVAVLCVLALEPFGLMRPAAATALVGKGRPCPTEPYTGGCIPGSTTTTTSVPEGRLVLTSSYVRGTLTWQVCGFPRGAAGSSVQLYVNGSPQMGTGGQATVGVNGCTPSTSDPVCLAAGSYQLAAVDQPFGEATGTLTVSHRDACRAAVSAGHGNGQANDPGNGQASGLAFTGFELLRFLIGAVILIGVGLAVVRLNQARNRGRGARL